MIYGNRNRHTVYLQFPALMSGLTAAWWLQKYVIIASNTRILSHMVSIFDINAGNSK